jgi:tight adherence protein C
MNTTTTVLIWLKWAALSTMGISIAVWIYPLTRIPLIAEPNLGFRGLKRRNMQQAASSFRLIEPIMRLIASWSSHLPLKTVRDRLDNILIRSGDSLGITPDELIALAVLGSLLLAACGVLISRYLEAGLLPPFVGLLTGASLPFLQLHTTIRNRMKEVNRTLPAAIDLAALCMGAGLDFPGALKSIVDNAPSRNSAVEEEFSRVLQELDIGHTRKQALQALEQRLPTPAIQNFVGAVVQAEDKGNPLCEVLQIQAQMLRMRRSVAAEEAAARAGALMMIPLFLLLCCILLVLFGPFIVNGIGL